MGFPFRVSSFEFILDLRIFYSLFAVLLLAGLAAAAPPKKPKVVAKPVLTAPTYAHHPHAVQFAFPFHAGFGGYQAFGSPFYGSYQQPQVVAVVDTDGVVRLIELRQLRGYQPTPAAVSPFQFVPQPLAPQAPYQMVPQVVPQK